MKNKSYLKWIVAALLLGAVVYGVLQFFGEPKIADKFNDDSNNHVPSPN